MAPKSGPALSAPLEPPLPGALGPSPCRTRAVLQLLATTLQLLATTLQLLATTLQLLATTLKLLATNKGEQGLHRGGGQPREGQIFDLHPPPFPGREFRTKGKKRLLPPSGAVTRMRC